MTGPSVYKSLCTRTMTVVVVLIGLLALVGELFGVGFGVAKTQIEDQVGLPVLAISGLVLLLGTLALVSSAFALFGIDDKSQALGLPEGSIRAVIALSLVVLFGIFAVYFYGTMSDGALESQTCLSPDAAREFITNLGKGQYVSEVTATCPGANAGQTLYTVLYRANLPDSTDFAKQVTTLLGTLLTAIASFYFGSKAAEPPGRETAPAAPVLTGVQPAGANQGSRAKVTLTGSNLASVRQVYLKVGTTKIYATDVAASDSSIAFTLDTTAAATGAWDVVVVSANGTEVALRDAFQITT